ncbi:substrate-binding domain-containing protein [Neisseriaceae bacterium TC5R-5]|nr:substrate-binding domain-containing protein [Neisseriaceae bacterium TC5R-5]
MKLRQLAALLQLSPATVSRALNGFAEVNAQTRARVLAAAKLHGYHANTIARKLATGRTDSIGLIYPFKPSDLGDPVFLEVIAGLTESLNEQHMDLVIISAAKANELATYQRVMSGRRVDGLVVARTLVSDPRLDLLQEKNFPFVAYGRSQQQSLPYAWFDYDNVSGMQLAVARLAALGHRKIALISASLTMNFANQRHQGFIDGLASAGLSPDPQHMLNGGLSPLEGKQAMIQLLNAVDQPSAVIVDNNIAAIGVVQALQQLGKQAGRDIALIVFGGLPSLYGESAAISAIMQPKPRQAGHVIAKLMLARLNGEDVAGLNQLWQPELIAAASDAVPGSLHG